MRNGGGFFEGKLEGIPWVIHELIYGRIHVQISGENPEDFPGASRRISGENAIWKKKL